MVDEFTRHCSELLAPLGAVRTRRMFGGQGIYVDELFIALIFDEQLYLKADAETRPRFEAEGCEPFIYQQNDGETARLSYYRPPEEAMESPPLMLRWARLALAAALRAKAAKAPKARIKPRSAPAAGKTRKAAGARKA